MFDAAADLVEADPGAILRRPGIGWRWPRRPPARPWRATGSGPRGRSAARRLVAARAAAATAARSTVVAAIAGARGRRRSDGMGRDPARVGRERPGAAPGVARRGAGCRELGEATMTTARGGGGRGRCRRGTSAGSPRAPTARAARSAIAPGHHDRRAVGGRPDRAVRGARDRARDPPAPARARVLDPADGGRRAAAGVRGGAGAGGAPVPGHGRGRGRRRGAGDAHLDARVAGPRRGARPRRGRLRGAAGVRPRGGRHHRLGAAERRSATRRACRVGPAAGHGARLRARAGRRGPALAPPRLPDQSRVFAAGVARPDPADRRFRCGRGLPRRARLASRARTRPRRAGPGPRRRRVAPGGDPVGARGRRRRGDGRRPRRCARPPRPPPAGDDPGSGVPPAREGRRLPAVAVEAVAGLWWWGSPRRLPSPLRPSRAA